ncbi:hypothetical protein [Bosea sp. CS1GBMeth4]|uniref:hypothetical protein n=1 Tax=Bosea sp. CS1GBMeth4 TaxID=1892849 RepID=UPI0016454079|nr:hypothetical protein [Bosea sp. CS1GBMeth4]
MPFSSLHDPGDLARACQLLDLAWARSEERGLVREGSERERTRLAYIIAALLHAGESDERLIDAALARYAATADGLGGTGDDASR